MSLFGIPFLGKNSFGETVTAVPSTSALVSANDASRIGGTDARTWSNIQITSLTKTSTDVIALGSGTDPSGNTQNVIWKNTGSNWLISHGFTGTFSPLQAVGSISSNYWVANGSDVLSTTMQVKGGSPAGGYSASGPTSLVVADDNEFPTSASSFSGTTSNLVAYTSSTLGTRVYPDWTRQTGEVEEVPTTLLETTYTFPGYSGANPSIQRVIATPVINGLPQNWTYEPTPGTAAVYPDSLAATALTIGAPYRIDEQGTTDFTQLGAADNNVGTHFVATHVGTGTGMATPLFTGFYGLVNAPSLGVSWSITT